MTTDPTMVELLRNALTQSTGDPQVDAITRASIRAGIVGDDDGLQNVYDDIVGPRQAELELHLTGPGVDGHATNAESLSDLVAGVSEVVKEASKAKAGLQRRTQNLLVEGVTPGSVRLVLRVPDPPNQAEGLSGSSTDSDALRAVAAVLDAATIDEDEMASKLTDFPPGAMSALRKITRATKRSKWGIEGRIRQRGFGSATIHFSPQGAARLDEGLSARTTTESTEFVVGRLDGFRRSLGAMYIIPDHGRPVPVSVRDSDLLGQVSRLAAETDPTARVRAEVRVKRSATTGTSPRVHTSRTLLSIEGAAPREEGVQLSTNE